MAKKKKSKRPNFSPKPPVGDPFLKLRDSMQDELCINRRDRTSSDYTKEIRKIADYYIQQTVSHIKRTPLGRNFIGRIKFDSTYQKRRAAAISEFAPIVAERFEDRFLKLDIEDVFARICTDAVAFVPDALENESEYILLACAIYILDELKDNFILREVLLYLPNEEELISEIDLPESFCDAYYENDVIKGMMYLILHRDDKEAGESDLDPFLNCVTVKRTAENVQPLEFQRSDWLNTDMMLSDYNRLKKAEANKMTYRERFNKIMSFIRPIVVSRAVTKFEKNMWELLEIIYKGVEYYENKRIAVVNKALDTVNRVLEIENSFLQAKQDYSSELSRDPFSADINVISAVSNMFPFDNLRPSYDRLGHNDDVSRSVSEIKKLLSSLDGLEEERDEADRETHEFISTVLSADSIYEQHKDVCAVCKEELDVFRISNPFETCFAYLYLSDTGSNIPWLFGAAGKLISYACELFPWSKTENRALWDAMDDMEAAAYAEDYEESENEQDEQESYEEPIDSTELDERFYAPVYTDYHDWTEEGIKRVRKDDLLHLNFPQFVYGKTLVNIPRKLDRYDNLSAAFKKSGFSSKHIDLLRMYLSLSDALSLRESFPEIKDDTEEVDAEKEAENAAALKKVIAEKNEEICRLKKELHKAESEKEQGKKKAEQRAADFEAERRELIELRELVYKMQNGSDEEIEEEDKGIELPYTAKSRIIVYGGHASWLRAIKPLLPSVRFIEPSTNPDPNLIRNADIVWMQSNAMPHSFYNKILDITRQRKITVKYFAFASAEKCAKQLAAFDMGNI